MVELELLQSLPLFHALPAERLEPLQTAAQRRACKAGEIIFRQGDVPEYFYVLESGAVDIVISTSFEEIIVASLQGGSFFGELTIFDREPRTATAKAVTDSSLICIPLGVVGALIEGYPPATRRFVSTIAGRLRAADEQISRLQTKNVNELADEQMTFGEKVADRVARFGGSWPFIISFGVFLLIWMGVNTSFLLRPPPDPFPYIFLNLILSCLAALQAPVIMMSQNRQAAKDRLQADEEFRINVKAEIAIQQLHRKLDELRANLLQHRHAEVAGRKA